MQQAARVSDFTAFMYLGELVEFDETSKIFTSPARPPHARLHHRPLRLRGQVSMSQHTVASFEDELRSLSRSIAEMGGRAEEIVEHSIAALLRSDVSLALQVIEADKKVDALHRQIEEDAIILIARRQPMAQDLREAIAAIRIANDLERVGDLGKNIAKRAVAIQKDSFSQKLRVGVEHLAELGA